MNFNNTGVFSPVLPRVFQFVNVKNTLHLLQQRPFVYLKVAMPDRRYATLELRCPEAVKLMKIKTIVSSRNSCRAYTLAK